MQKIIDMEMVKYKDEVNYIDLNDVLDIIEEGTKSHYSIVFYDGEVWKDIKLKKTTFNKFNKIKAKRGQV